MSDPNGPVEKAVEETQEAVRRLSPHGLASLAGDVGWGFFTLSVALYAGAMSYNKFSAVIKERGRVVSS